MKKLTKADYTLRITVGILIFMLGGLGALALILSLPFDNAGHKESMESESPFPVVRASEVPFKPLPVQSSTKHKKVPTLPTKGEIPYYEEETLTYEEWYEQWTGPSY